MAQQVRPWLRYALGGAIVLAIIRRKDIALTVKMIQKAAHPTNHGGFRTAKIDTIVLHTTEGKFSGAVAWFAMVHEPPYKPSSAHYVISAKGDIVQMVPDNVIAWHASDPTVNNRSIGIELEGAAADPATWTAPLLTALVELTTSLRKKYGIPNTRSSPGLLAHSDVPAAQKSGKVDPGEYFPWDDFLYAIS